MPAETLRQKTEPKEIYIEKGTQFGTFTVQKEFTVFIEPTETGAFKADAPILCLPAAIANTEEEAFQDLIQLIQEVSDEMGDSKGGIGARVSDIRTQLSEYLGLFTTEQAHQ